MVEKRLGCKWSGFRKGSENRKSNHLNSGQMAAILSNHLQSGQKRTDFEWSSFQMVGTIAIAKARTFENRTIWNLTFKKSRFQMVKFQIPTKSHLWFETFLYSGKPEEWFDDFFFLDRSTASTSSLPNGSLKQQQQPQQHGAYPAAAVEDSKEFDPLQQQQQQLKQLQIQVLVSHISLTFVCTFSWKEKRCYTIPKCQIRGFMCNNKCHQFLKYFMLN